MWFCDRSWSIISGTSVYHTVRIKRSYRNGFDIGMANAGLYSFGSTWELTEQQWDETLAVVLKGVWLTCKVAIPQMIRQRKGKIIYTASRCRFPDAITRLGRDVVADAVSALISSSLHYKGHHACFDLNQPPLNREMLTSHLFYDPASFSRLRCCW